MPAVPHYGEDPVEHRTDQSRCRPRGGSRRCLTATSTGRSSYSAHSRMRVYCGRACPRILRCEECGCLDDGQERGWTLHIGDDDGLYTFCPDCDGREFGSGSRSRRRRIVAASNSHSSITRPSAASSSSVSVIGREAPAPRIRAARSASSNSTVNATSSSSSPTRKRTKSRRVAIAWLPV
jgi:hypothetical protein